MQHDVVVVGSGVSGLSCAHTLACAGLRVQIVARALPPATTSNVAAAFWYPYYAFPRPAVLAWAADSWQRFALIADQADAGVRMADAVELLRLPPTEAPWWGKAAAQVHPAPPDWLPEGFAAGWRFVAPVVDTRRYLPWLAQQVAQLGVQTVQRELSSLTQLVGHANVVVDCAGLGARALVPDPTLQAIRGQLVLVDNPGLSRVVLDEQDPAGVTYIVPRGDDCVLGGTHEPGVETTLARAEHRDAILARCIALEPRLAGARVLADVVGLRPGRATIRLDAQTNDDGLRVVHNYGHGGAGVTLSWGCAQAVARLVAGQLGQA